MPCKRCRDRHMLLSHRFAIPYYYARLVMIRHFYGVSHGLPLQKLQEQTCIHYTDGVIKLVSQHARVVDDLLLVLSACSTSHTRDDSTSLRDHINNRIFRICAHITIRERCSPYAPIKILNLAKDEAKSLLILPCDQAFKSCNFCLTDYSMEMCWNSKKKGYVVELLIYRQQTMSEMRMQEEPPRAACSLDYRPGYVREQWIEAGR
jgi:hypothetical protein